MIRTPRHHRGHATRRHQTRRCRRLPLIAVVGGLLVVAACVGSGDEEATAPTDGRPPAVQIDSERQVEDVDCERMIHHGGLPAWAAGAGIDSARFVVADDDLVLGVLWADPLVAGEPSPDRPNNKILWVVNRPREGSDLEITATPYGRSEPVVSHTFPDDSGPGEIYPSIVDLPEPGCWQLELRWAGHEAIVLVPYVAAQPA